MKLKSKAQSGNLTKESFVSQTKHSLKVFRVEINSLNEGDFKAAIIIKIYRFSYNNQNSFIRALKAYNILPKYEKINSLSSGFPE